MKVYIYRYGSICEPDIIASLTQLGFDVDEECIELTNKNISTSECISIASKKLLSTKYVFVFTINFFPWLSDLCNIIKIPYISLIVDSPVMELYSNSLKNKYNYVFIFDKILFNEFYNVNIGHIFHVPLATNITRTDNLIKNTPDNIKNKFKCDISFIGSTYEEKCPYNRNQLSGYNLGFAEALIEAQLKVYGYNFIEEIITDEFVNSFLESTPYSYRFPDNYNANYKAVVAQLYLSVKVSEQERLRALKLLSENFNMDIYTNSDTSSMPLIHNKGLADSIKDMPIIFNQSKININISSKSIRSGLPLRIFDVLGCHGFLITNYQSEIPEIFEIGKDLVIYESLEDLKEKCYYYLEHEDERMQIAENGYNKIKKFHTFNKRLLQIFELVFK